MIFFDIDGTLVDQDSAETTAALAFQQIHRVVFPEPANQFLARWRNVSWKYVKQWLSGETSFQGQRRLRLQELFAHHCKLTDAQADELIGTYIQRFEEGWRLYEDVAPCLAAMEGQKLGVISNGDSRQQRQKLEMLGLADRFSVIVVFGDVGIAKPDCGIFHAACEAAGMRPEQCVYVGDDLEVDALGSARSGMRGIWLNRTGAACPAGVASIGSLDELPRAVDAY